MSDDSRKLQITVEVAVRDGLHPDRALDALQYMVDGLSDHPDAQELGVSVKRVTEAKAVDRKRWERERARLLGVSP